MPKMKLTSLKTLLLVVGLAIPFGAVGRTLPLAANLVSLGSEQAPASWSTARRGRRTGR